VFLGEVLLHHYLMRPHRAAFRLHCMRNYAALTVQRHSRGRQARLHYQRLWREKKAAEHEAARQQLHQEAHEAVANLNTHYEQVDIEQIEAKGPYAGGLAGPWDPQRSPRMPEPEPEPELELEAADLAGSSDEEDEMQTPTPPVAKRKGKGGRPAGLKTGRARRRGGSVEATMAFAGMTEAQKTSLVVRPNKTFKAAGNKIKAALHLANMIGGAPTAAANGATGANGSDSEALALNPAHDLPSTLRLQPKPAPAVPHPPPLKKQQQRKGKGKKAGASYANAKPRYLQHLEPKKLPEKNRTLPPAPVAAQAGRRPESGRGKLPPIGARHSARETGSVRMVQPPVRGRHSARAVPTQLSPLARLTA
jgi:hypothetical protein